MKKLLLTALAALTLSACNNDNNGPDTQPLVSNIVTYDGSDEATQTSRFSFQVIDDSPVINITANTLPTKPVKPGTRFLAYYNTDTPDKSGPVTMRQLASIPGGNPVDSAGVAAPFGAPLQMQALWRSGHYINVYANINFSGTARRIGLYVDPATLAGPEVNAYMAVEPPSVIQDSAPRLLAASWNVDALWSLSTVKTLNVSYVDASGATQSVKFSKQ